MKILIGTNSLANVPQEVYANHRAEYYTLGKKHKIVEGNLIDWSSKRLSIDRMRNECAKIALNNECDYLVFIDDDMLLHPGTIDGLIESDYDIIMAHTYIRGYPFQCMSFNNQADPSFEGVNLVAVTDEEIENAEKTGSGILDCYAVGFATCAIKVSILQQMQPPYFVTGQANTEDIYFCIRAKKEIGANVKIGVHTKYPTAHLVDPIFIHRNNKKKLLELYAPNEEKKFREDDRGGSYHERITNKT
jgi:hypothetical protein